jgi:hypothetical protein
LCFLLSLSPSCSPADSALLLKSEKEAFSSVLSFAYVVIAIDAIICCLFVCVLMLVAILFSLVMWCKCLALRAEYQQQQKKRKR